MICDVATNRWRRAPLWASGDFIVENNQLLARTMHEFSGITVNTEKRIDSELDFAN